MRKIIREALVEWWSWFPQIGWIASALGLAVILTLTDAIGYWPAFLVGMVVIVVSMVFAPPGRPYE